MSFTTTPKKITEEIKNFCAKVNPKTSPFYVDVVPGPYSSIKNCFSNVREQVKTEGGKPVLGWTIWGWPNLIIEAEFHCVWENDDGETLDITPLLDKESQILFLPDGKISLDLALTKKVHNIRHVLTKDPLFKEYISICEKMNDIEDESDHAPVGSPLGFLQAKVQLAIWKKYVSKNDPCPCSSGKKFKKCCLNRTI